MINVASVILNIFTYLISPPEHNQFPTNPLPLNLRKCSSHSTYVSTPCAESLTLALSHPMNDLLIPLRVRHPMLSSPPNRHLPQAAWAITLCGAADSPHGNFLLHCCSNIISWLLSCKDILLISLVLHHPATTCSPCKHPLWQIIFSKVMPIYIPSDTPLLQDTDIPPLKR